MTGTPGYLSYRAQCAVNDAIATYVTEGDAWEGDEHGFWVCMVPADADTRCNRSIKPSQSFVRDAIAEKLQRDLGLATLPLVRIVRMQDRPVLERPNR